MNYDIWDFTKKDNFNQLHTYLNFSFANSKSYLEDGMQCRLTTGNFSSFPDKYVINIRYRVIDPDYRDWSHLFSFGTHNNSGGDNPQYPLAFDICRSNIAGCSIRYDYSGHYDDLTTFLKQWNIYSIEVKDGKTNYYINRQLIKTLNVKPTNTRFYFNGSGSGSEPIGVLGFVTLSDKVLASIIDYYSIMENENNFYGLIGVKK